METETRPPGPDLSKLAALRAFRNDPIALLERLATYGDVVRVDVPGSAAFLLNHPDLVRDVLVTEHRSFHKGPTIRAAKMLLGESLLTSEDETHLRQRRLIQPMFHHERIATYAASMVRSAERAAERWSDGDELDVQAEMSALTLAVVGETLFGTDVDAERSATVRRALTDTLGMFDRVYSPLFRLLVRLPSPTMRRYHRVESDLNRVIAEMIAERRAAGATGDDLLSLLLRAREDGAGMTDEQVRDEALTLFLAGHETTAIALTWTWWLLARNPDAETRLHAELDTTLPDRAAVGRRTSPNLPYTQAVISESIRLRPPAWAMGRTAVAGHRANGYPIAEGSTVVVSPWLLHHDPRWWPEPEAFRPERWLADDPERPRYAFIPFGGGPRVCIGEPFARLEAAMLLATIARRWRFASRNDREPDLQAVITLRPRGGLPMRALPRRTETDRRVLAHRDGPVPCRDQLEVLAPLAERLLQLLRQALDELVPVGRVHGGRHRVVQRRERRDAGRRPDQLLGDLQLLAEERQREQDVALGADPAHADRGRDQQRAEHHEEHPDRDADEQRSAVPARGRSRARRSRAAAGGAGPRASCRARARGRSPGAGRSGRSP